MRVERSASGTTYGAGLTRAVARGRPAGGGRLHRPLGYTAGPGVTWIIPEHEDPHPGGIPSQMR